MPTTTPAAMAALLGPAGAGVSATCVTLMTDGTDVPDWVTKTVLGCTLVGPSSTLSLDWVAAAAEGAAVDEGGMILMVPVESPGLYPSE